MLEDSVRRTWNHPKVRSSTSAVCVKCEYARRGNAAFYIVQQLSTKPRCNSWIRNDFLRPTGVEPMATRTMDWLTARSRRPRAMLRPLGYGSILFVLAMMQLPLGAQTGHGLLTSIVAGTPVLVGPASLLLLVLVSKPKVSRREEWIACLLVWVFLFALLIRVLRMD